MGIFDTTYSSCPTLPSPSVDADPIAGSLTFTQLSQWISGIAAAVTVAIGLGLVILHVSHMSRPEEQVRIIRILLLLPAFALLSFGSTFLNVNAIDLQTWMHPCESIALASFFQLVCVFGQPRPGALSDGPTAGFEPLPPRPKDGPLRPVYPTASMQIRVFQYVPVSIFVSTLTCITQAAGVYCGNSNAVNFGHIWLMIIQAVSVVIAAMTIIKFTYGHKKELAHNQPMQKLICFKALIGISFVQTFVFSFAAGKFTPSNTFAYTDLTASLPAMLLNIELIIFSIGMIMYYNHRPYSFSGKSGRYNGGAGALVHALNPLSIVKDLLTPYY